MRINKITYYNHESEWRFTPIEFSNFTLLVGASGVGKTQILESIMNLRKIAKGESLNGIEWDINFTIQNDNYQWKGIFENKEVSSFKIEIEKNEKEQFKIIREELYRNKKVIIERSHNEIKFHNNKLPRLSPFQSIIEILREEEDIAPIRDGFSKIIHNAQLTARTSFADILVASIVSRKKYSLEDIQESDFEIQIKLALAYKYIPEIFNKIKKSFIDIFSQVEDVKLGFVEIDKDISESLLKILSTKAEYLSLIYVKEKGVNRWIHQQQISSGMLKTLLYISELYLSTKDTVVLIDEFENSLGVNCIDVVTDFLLKNRDMQFIITSHHPYIINSIPLEFWKIVTRRGGVVTATNAREFNLGKSKHQGFMQLINLDAYKEGIIVG